MGGKREVEAAEGFASFPPSVSCWPGLGQLTACWRRLPGLVRLALWCVQYVYRGKEVLRW